MADHTPCIHQPGVFNIEMFDGTQWRCGRNRSTLAAAIATAKLWANDTGCRHRVFSPERELVFDTDTEVMHIAKPSQQARLQRQLAQRDARDALAADLALYPDRPYAIDVVALLADPHYDEHWRGDMIAGADAVANLLNVIQAMQGAKTRTGIVFSHEQIADLALAATRVAGGMP
jgi:hypothetical protein